MPFDYTLTGRRVRAKERPLSFILDGGIRQFNHIKVNKPAEEGLYNISRLHVARAYRCKVRKVSESRRCRRIFIP